MFKHCHKLFYHITDDYCGLWTSISFYFEMENNNIMLVCTQDRQRQPNNTRITCDNMSVESWYSPLVLCLSAQRYNVSNNCVDTVKYNVKLIQISSSSPLIPYKRITIRGSEVKRTRIYYNLYIYLMVYFYKLVLN